jgi:hypothetical protein
MSMVTRSQFKDALYLIEEYAAQVQTTGILPHQIGCRVELSEYGKSVEREIGKRAHTRKGTVIDWLMWHSVTDGLVTIKWDGVKVPETRHVGQVQAVPNIEPTDKRSVANTPNSSNQS